MDAEVEGGTCQADSVNLGRDKLCESDRGDGVVESGVCESDIKNIVGQDECDDATSAIPGNGSPSLLNPVLGIGVGPGSGAAPGIFKVPTLRFKISKFGGASDIPEGEPSIAEKPGRPSVAEKARGTSVAETPGGTSVVLKTNSLALNCISEQIQTGEEVRNIPAHIQPKTCQAPSMYNEPSWGGTPEAAYHLEVLKNGKLLQTLSLAGRSFHLFGRSPSCQFTLEHPSVSRCHVIFQYGSGPEGAGLYVFDTGSTHGSFLNKERVTPRCYIRVKVGHQLRFGSSTRWYIVHGPAEDAEAASDLTITQLKERKTAWRAGLAGKRSSGVAGPASGPEPSSDQPYCDWGLLDDPTSDPEEQADGDVNPYSCDVETPLNISDPKKTLRGFFDREGEELEYRCEENGTGKYTCRVTLPIDDHLGRPVEADATVSGKKREAVVQCAMEACRILDQYGVLRQSHPGGRSKRLKKDWDGQDYYDSDDDNFLDRTGDLQKKREFRMRRSGKLKKEAQTHENLTERLSEVERQFDVLSSQLEEAKKFQREKESESLDDYMDTLKQGALAAKERFDLKKRLFELRKDKLRLQRLVKLTEPAKLPDYLKRKPVVTESRTKEGFREEVDVENDEDGDVVAGSGTVMAGCDSAVAGCDSAVAGCASAVVGCASAVAGCDSVVAGSGTVVSGRDSAVAGSDSAVAGCDSVVTGRDSRDRTKEQAMEVGDGAAGVVGGTGVPDDAKPLEVNLTDGKRVKVSMKIKGPTMPPGWKDGMSFESI